MSTRFHIKRNGDLGPCKAKQGNCPFGGESGEENHFDSIEEATKAFEKKWAGELVPKAVKKPAQKKAIPVVRPRDYLDPSKSKVIKEAEVADQDGYMGGSRFVGGKVKEGRIASGSSYMPSKYVTSAIRKDLKEAVSLGELPQDLSYSVRKNSGGFVDSVTITVGKKAGRSTEIIPADYYTPSKDFGKTGGETDEGKRLRMYLEALGNQWCESDINSQVDYFHSSHRARVQWVG